MAYAMAHAMPRVMKIVRRYAAQDDFRAAPDRMMVITSKSRHRLLPRVVI
jgi:hypothetical protein